MFEALIEFIEESIFGLINRILDEDKSMTGRCEKVLSLVLGFAQKNPGITRLMTGDALVGETERLRKRVDKFYERLETQLKQILREGEAQGALPKGSPIPAQANMLLCVIEGRINQFVRSSFSSTPMQYWEVQWPLLKRSLEMIPD